MDSGIWNLWFEIWNVKVIWNLESGIKNPKYEIWNMNSGIWNMDSEIWILKYETWNLKSGIWILKSEFWSMKSEIWKINLKSEIWNMKAEVWNRKSNETRADTFLRLVSLNLESLENGINLLKKTWTGLVDYFEASFID